MIRVPDTPISAIVRDLRRGKYSSSELVEQCLSTIVTYDPSLNAFITVLEDEVRTEADAADRAMAQGHIKGPLHGIPISLKDILDVEGVATTAASRVRLGHQATRDAIVVSRLRAAGAIIIGKCNLHEFAFGTTGEDSAAGPTRNPHDHERIPGGSSSGSAVSVASGMAIASIGTDTGGSIRIPASACGIVGLKPTFNEVPCDGVIPLAPTLDHVGPLTRTVADAHLLYRTISDKSTSVESSIAESNQKTSFGIPRSYFFDVIDRNVGTAFESTIRRLEATGGTIVDVDIPHASDTATIYLHTQLPEAAMQHRKLLETKRNEYCPSVRTRLELGGYVLAQDYVLAQQGRKVLTKEVDDALRKCDVLLLPTLPILPPNLGSDMVTVGNISSSVRALTLRMTQLFDLTGHPAISLPSGFVKGLPVGTQLVGNRYQTSTLLSHATRYEDSIRG